MTVNLRAERINRGLTVTSAADQMGVARGTLDKVERGLTQPHASTAYLIAKFYGYQVTDVWPLEDSAPA